MCKNNRSHASTKNFEYIGLQNRKMSLHIDCKEYDVKISYAMDILE
jgi:hypothetical protein